MADLCNAINGCRLRWQIVMIHTLPIEYKNTACAV